ncbi:uncharacterized protein LOC111880170 isoform X2 [Lactuca sativa]|uniref:uncharacterized protein LOC111880170 isoform X2 n=1 Tax=Lactuca sativa TaxID=4236 RepID=UPI000CD829DE|nr:uncharacterized protein LOC111880170 isoform X2 [Lactuca sativa]
MKEKRMMRWKRRYDWMGRSLVLLMSSLNKFRRVLTTCVVISNKPLTAAVTTIDLRLKIRIFKVPAMNLTHSLFCCINSVLESNPWRGDAKPVYVLTRRENQLCTMKTRMNRSEVERELGMLFSKGRKLRNQTKKPTPNKFQMLVEDVRDGVLVFEDETEAAKYCDLLQGNCEGVAEIEASSVFDLCQKMRALAVLFRRGRTPPLPESLKLNLSARKRSLEDQDDVI